MFLGKQPFGINGANSNRTSWGLVAFLLLCVKRDKVTRGREVIVAQFYPLLYNSYIKRRRKIDYEDVNRFARRFGKIVILSLSNGADATSPPLVVVGGITFY